MMKIKIYSTNKYMLSTKIYLLKKFCNIFSLKHLIFKGQTKCNTINLLKSPHIHKKTWRKYKLYTYEMNFHIIIQNSKIFLKINKLMNIMNHNCKMIFKMNF